MSSPFPPPNVKVLSVGELTLALKNLLEGGYSAVWVEGEVSNLARPNSGHVYLTLKDGTAPLKAVVYRGVALRLKFDLRDGTRVIARGRLVLYVPRGEYQPEIEEVQPKGIGPLELAFRQLKEKLSLKGYFEPRRAPALEHAGAWAGDPWSVPAPEGRETEKMRPAARSGLSPRRLHLDGVGPPPEPVGSPPVHVEQLPAPGQGPGPPRPDVHIAI
jgi:hypothetical protein